ncbi:hypothetical protein DFH08DRAFT_826814 [Mycena albidolilacea]|uniref:Uncharacterized protein n=1 Tax=Mycena albidolilacea TaxID=1033008 RepID=A0AAD6Z081_9AGAR|nr:hypothetical protein DFH08DRAFT_826814 [Mycena albidolilacea]
MAGLAFNCRDYDLHSDWYKCKHFVAQSQELCDTSSWVVLSSLVDAEDAVMGKIIEVLRRTDSMEGLVILEQYTIQPERHEVFNMPVLVPKRHEEAVFLLLNPKDIQFAFNVQHDCSSGTCKPSGKRPVLQERQETRLEECFIEHDSLAERLREGREARKAKNAATAAARKALKPGASKVAKRKKTATGLKRTRTGDAGRKSGGRGVSPRDLGEPGGDSDSESGEEGDGGGGKMKKTRNGQAERLRRKSAAASSRIETPGPQSASECQL